MSLQMFRNRLYNTIIAISLVIAIAVVTSYTPELFEKKSVSDVQASNEIKYEEPQIRVESAKKSLELSKAASALDSISSKKETKIKIENLGKTVSDLKESIKDEVANAKKKSKSDIISKRAEEYKSTAINGLDSISKKVESLNKNISSLSDKDIDRQIKEIKNEIEDIQKVEVPEVKYNDEAHGMAEGYKPSNIVGEQLVKSDISQMAAPTESKSVSYLELNNELKELADTFDTPAQIYEYVRNNYMYKQYTGLRLGAIGTYEQRAGNDLDQAALLIALFRYKKYDAEFVIGNVDIDINKAMNWLGVNTEQAAVDAMSMLGVPTQYGKDEEGNITKLRIEHAWVKVKVPYDSYRGAGKVSGEEIWVELDPSFKEFEETDKSENETESDKNLKEFLKNKSEKMSDASGITDWVEILSTEAEDCFPGYEEEYTDSENDDNSTYDYNDVNDYLIPNLLNYKVKGQKNEEAFAQMENDVESYFGSNDAVIKEVGSVLGIRYILKDESGYLPTSLSYSVVERTYEERYIPDEYMDTITLSLQSPLYGSVFMSESDAKVTFYTADLYGHRVSLTYSPATEKDSELINEYGNLFATPSYLVRVKPVIAIDGEEIISGEPQIPGTYTNLIIDIAEAGIENVRVENPLLAGGMYGITFDYNTINDVSLEGKRDELQDCVNKVQSGEISLTEATAILTNTVGETYFSYLDYYNQLLSAANDVVCARSISECIVGYVPKVSSVMGMPIAVSDGSLYIDVDTDTAGVTYIGDKKTESENEKIDETERTEEYISNTKEKENEHVRNYMMMSGVTGSYLEGYVVGETAGCKGISSVSIITEAKKRGIDIVALSNENRDKLISLGIENSTKREIEKALNNGKIVIVPEKDIYYYDWHGTGYVVLNTDTGEAAYMISGGLCGGETSHDLAWYIFTFLLTVVAILALCVCAHFLWVSVYAFTGIMMAIGEGISLIDLCVLLMSIMGAVYAIQSSTELYSNYLNYMATGNMEAAKNIFEEAYELGKIMLIFEYLIPNLMGPMIAKSGFRETKLYEFITRKYGGKDIEFPDIVDPGKPNDPFDGEKPNDPNNHNNNENLKDNNTGNDENLKDNNSDNTSGNNSENNQSEDLTNDNQRLENDEFWKVAFKKYDNDVIEKIRPFGEDGKALIEIYEKEGRIDEIIDIINKLPEEDVEQGIQLMIDYLDDAVDSLKAGKSLDNVKYDCLGGKQYRDSLLDDVETGKIELKSNKQKGNYGEMKMDKYLEDLGYERISLDRVTGLDDPIHQGIDGVYYNPEGTPQYIIAEAKYGSARLGNTIDGPQMSDSWINGSNRLRKAVGNEKMTDIIISGYEKWLVRVKTDGNIIKTVLE